MLDDALCRVLPVKPVAPGLGFLSEEQYNQLFTMHRPVASDIAAPRWPAPPWVW